MREKKASSPIPEELIRRLAITLDQWNGKFPTGAGGLSRKELRRLERAGLVVSKLRRLDSGTLVKWWSRPIYD